ncbi:MAG: SusC/RagA family TonB-linked outer membrane protein [Bacteroidota bacterium]
MNKYILTIAALFCVLQLQGQARTMQGNVVDETGEPLIGATVVVQPPDGGSPIGTITDFDGNFTVEAPEGVNTLTVTYVGYESQIVDITGLTTVNVALSPSTEQLEEVVVTALGIKKEKKALGYSFADVDGEELTTNRDPNFINAISNKVAGVNISQTAGGAGTSSRIIIRGIKSLSTESQPLIVIDGVQMDNSSDGASWLGGIDYGSSLGGVSPDDIESMSVLKGPNAAALYGSRAATGVIIITTKKGSRKEPLSVTVNSNFMFDRAYIMGKYQNEYGAGDQGNIIKQILPPAQQEKFGMDSAHFSHSIGSWGPALDGTFEDSVLNWNWEFIQLSPQPDNVKNFFENGYTFTNSVGIQSGTEQYNWRMSLSSLNNKGLNPTSTYDRYNASFIMDSKLNDFLSVSYKGSYIREEAHNRVGQGNSETGAKTFIWMPRSINIRTLERDYMDENGFEQNYYNTDYLHTNPFWEVYENFNNDSKDQFTGFMKIDIKITPWLKGFVRTNMDTYGSKRYLRIATGAIRANREGRFTEQWVNYRSMNHDFLLSADRSIGENWNLSANFGGSYYAMNVDAQSTTIKGLAVPNFFSINNAKYPDQTSAGVNKRQKVIQSLYGSTQLQYKNYLYIDLTGRSDWSSTLPLENNPYFYPSVNTSFVFTNFFEMKSNLLTFGKVRFSYAYVGNDTNPYNLSHQFINQQYGDVPAVYLRPVGFKEDLEPESTGAWEVGADLRFWMNRVSMDITYYNETTYDQIVPAAISSTTGLVSIVTNGGEINNKGIEIQMSITPVEINDFGWDINLNFARNRNEVLSLAEGVNQLPITSTSQIEIFAIPGEPYGQIRGKAMKKYYRTDASGNVIDDPNNGRPLIDEEGKYIMSDDYEVIGNITPDWTGGITNNLHYKNWSLTFSIGIKMGGDIYSKTNKYGMDQGQFVETLEGRESWYAATPEEKLMGREGQRDADGNAIEDGDGNQIFDEVSDAVGYLASGVVIDTITGEARENTMGIDPQVYHHQRKWGGIAEMDIYDGTYVKLRDVTLNYNFPESWFNNGFIKRGSFALVGRNLWLIYSGVPNIDPESSFTSNNNGLGQEYAAMPTTRSIGFNLKLVF